MKKTSKIFGAVVCSAALAVGCAMPAFAAGNGYDDGKAGKDTTYSNADGTLKDDTGTATGPKTDINLRTYTDQIDCTLPLKVTVAVDIKGGAITPPTNYQIKNNVATSPLYITKLAATADSLKWKAAGMGSWSTGTTIPKDPSATYGTVFMTINDAVVAGQNGGAAANFNTVDNLNWKAPKATEDTGAGAGILNLPIAGATSEISGIDTDKTAGAALLSVAYTVTAMNPADTALATQITTDTGASVVS